MVVVSCDCRTGVRFYQHFMRLLSLWHSISISPTYLRRTLVISMCFKYVQLLHSTLYAMCQKSNANLQAQKMPLDVSKLCVKCWWNRSRGRRGGGCLARQFGCCNNATVTVFCVCRIQAGSTHTHRRGEFSGTLKRTPYMCSSSSLSFESNWLFVPDFFMSVSVL